MSIGSRPHWFGGRTEDSRGSLFEDEQMIQTKLEHLVSDQCEPGRREDARSFTDFEPEMLFERHAVDQPERAQHPEDAIDRLRRHGDDDASAFTKQFVTGVCQRRLLAAGNVLQDGKKSDRIPPGFHGPHGREEAGMENVVLILTDRALQRLDAETGVQVPAQRMKELPFVSADIDHTGMAPEMA